MAKPNIAFNLAALRPGAKLDMAAIKRKKAAERAANGEPDPSADQELFDKPVVGRRRAKSHKRGLDLVEDEKEYAPLGGDIARSMAVRAQSVEPPIEEQKSAPVSEELSKRLTERMSPTDLQDAQILKHPNMDDSIQPAAESLEAGLSGRVAASELDARGITNSKISATLQDTARNLEKQQKTDALKKSMGDRPEESDLVSTGVMVSSSVAPSLQSTAQQLERQQKRDAVQQGMKTRTDVEELVESGVRERTSLAGSLQATVRTLEHQQKTDAVRQGIDARPSEETLVNTGMKNPSSVAASLQATQRQLDRAQKTDAVSRGVSDRPDEKELVIAGVKQPASIAASLQATAKQLEHQQTTDAIRKGVDGRPDEAQLVDSGIRESSNLANSLQATARALDRQKKTDAVRQGVDARPEDDALLAANVLISPRTVAPSLQATQHQLDRQQKTDAVRKGVSDQPDVNQLVDSGVMHSTTVAPSLQNTARELDRQQKTDAVRQGVAGRPDEDELVAAGVKTSSQLASQLQATAKQLEAEQKRDAVRKGVSKQPDREELEAAGLVGSAAVAPALHDAVRQLEKEQQKDSVNKKIVHRPTGSSLERAGILQSRDVAPGMQAAVKEMEFQSRIRGMQDNINSRMDETDLMDRGILYSDQIDPSIQSAAYDLDKTLKSRTTEEALQRADILKYSNVDGSLQPRADALESHLQTRDEVKSQTIAPALAQTARQLELKTKGLRLNEQLLARPTLDEVADQNYVVSPRLANSLQGAGYQVEEGLRVRADEEFLKRTNILPDSNADPAIQNLAARMEDQLGARTPRSELMDSNILFSDQAPAIQGAAKSLQEDLVGRASESDLASRGIVRHPNIASSIRPAAESVDEHLRERASSSTAPDAVYSTTMAAAIQPSAAELQGRMQHRPPDSALREQGILKHDGMASSIQPQAEQVQSRMEQRPDAGELINEGIMQDPRRVAPAIQGASQQLQDELVGRPPEQPVGLVRQSSRADEEIRFAPEYRQNIQGRLERRLSHDLRPQREDLVKQGILPPGYWADWQTAERERYQHLQNTQQEVRELLARRLDITHFIDLGLTPQYFLEKDFEDALESVRRARQNTEDLLQRRLDPKRRMSKVDMEQRNFVPSGYWEDHDRALFRREYGNEAVKAQLLDFLPQRPNTQQLEERHIVESASDFNYTTRQLDQIKAMKRQTTGEELNQRLRRRPSVADIVAKGVAPADVFSEAVKDIAKRHKRIESAAEDLSSQLPMPPEVGKIVAGNWLKQMDTGLEDDTGPVSPLDIETRESRDSVIAREKAQMRRRLSQTLEDAFVIRPDQMQLQRDGILPRTNVAPALQGAAVDLQSRLNDRMAFDDLKHKNIVRRPSMSASLQPAAESLEEQIMRNWKILHHEDRQGQQYYTRNLAASLQQAANQLHRRRTSVTLENALNARPTREDLMDMQILLAGDMAASLQGAAHNLQEQLRTRVPEDYLQKRNILSRGNMAASIQPTAEQIERKVRQSYIKRRDSMSEIPVLFDGKEDEGENAMDQVRRERVASDLDRRLANRLTQNQLVSKGVVPTREYWEDWEWAVQQLEIGRRLHTEDLKRLIKDRDKAQDLVARGLIHPAYLSHDADTARAIIKRDKQLAFQKLSASIAVPKSERVKELEERNILPKNYIEEVTQSVMAGSTTEQQAISELTDKLLSRPEMTQVIAEQLIGNLEDDEDLSDLDSDNVNSHLEKALKRRPSVDDVKNKGYLFSDEMAPAIQQPAAALEGKLRRRRSIADVVGDGILKRSNVAPSIQPAAEDLEKQFQDGKMMSREEMAARGILLDNDAAQEKRNTTARTKETLNKRLARSRRATVVDMELRGIIPGGYFDDARTAIQSKQRRRDSIVKELASRLRMRPDVTEVYASRILTNAIQKRHSVMQSEIRTLESDRRHEIERTLARKLDHRRRPSIEDLSKRGVLPFTWDPTQSQHVIQQRLELEKAMKIQAVAHALQSRRSPEDMIDSQYIYSLQMAPSLQGVAKQLESQLQTRVGEEYLQRDDVGILKKSNMAPALQPAAHLIDGRIRRNFQQELARQNVESGANERGMVAGVLNRRLSLRPDVHRLFQLGIEKPAFMSKDVDEAAALENSIRSEIEQRLDKSLRRRPSVDVLQRTGIVPFGAFEDPQSAARKERIRRQSISEDLHDSLQGRPDMQTLLNMGYIPQDLLPKKGTKSREEQRIPSPQPPPRYSPQPPPPRPKPQSQARQEQLVPYQGEQLPSTSPAYEAHQSSIISSGGYSPPLPPAPKPPRRPAPPGPPPPSEPVLDMNVVVDPPDLHTNALMTSPLAFQSLLDQLNAIVNEKKLETSRTLADMKARADMLKDAKRIYYFLEMGLKDDLGDDFKSSGNDVEDTAAAKDRYLELQNEMFELDSKVQERRKEARLFEKEFGELEKTRDEFQTQMSALRRVSNHLSEVLRDQNTHHDSAIQARRATELQQGFMIARITDKIAHTHLKIDQLGHLADTAPTEAEREEYKEELNVSTSFLEGLQEFLSGLRRIRHEQAARIRHIENVVEILKVQQLEVNEQLQRTQEEVKVKLEKARHDLPLAVNQSNFNMPKMISRPPLSFADLQRKRRQRMSKVTRKLQELEQRALSTSSSDYLRSLTEIKQLQQIVSNDAMKYFFNTFVQKSNQIFNDILMSHNTSTLIGLNGANPMGDSYGIKFVTEILKAHSRLDEESLGESVDLIVSFVQSLPDREVVIMQIARYLAMSPTHRASILNCDDNIAGIEKLVSTRCREWIGSILSLYGGKSSCKNALAENIIAQVQPHFAAALVCDTVYGLDVRV